MPSTFTARYASTCSKCGCAINPGDSVTWNRRGAKGTYHAACSDAPSTLFQEEEETPQPTPAPRIHQAAPAPDQSGLGPMLAAIVQPYIQAQAADVGANWMEIPAGAFKQSGTDVPTRLLFIDKR